LSQVIDFQELSHIAQNFSQKSLAKVCNYAKLCFTLQVVNKALMQSNKEILRDTRTLPEISAGLSLERRASLRFDLVSGLRVCELTVRNWMSGRYIPTNHITKVAATEIIKKNLGIEVSEATLFPANHES
jgi:hypothetical protein